ncbi:MAG: hypothetical protein ACKOI0_04335, partial [Actinomycetota bacterium]
MRFPIRFRGVGRFLPFLGLTRTTSYVDLHDDRIDVRMGWAFRASAPRAPGAGAGPAGGGGRDPGGPRGVGR